MTPYGVLHLKAGHAYRGGQRQVYNLAGYLSDNGIDTGCVVSSGGELERRLTGIGIATYPIEYGGLDIAAESIRLRRVCSEMGYSIVHAHDSHGHNIALTMRFLNPALRLVVTRRVLSGKSKTLLSRWKYRSRNTDLFIAVSSAVEDELIDWGVPDGRIVRIPSGVDRTAFAPVSTDDFRREHNLPDRKFRIGTACALDDNKDVETLINAVAKLSYERDDFMLLVAGSGEKRSYLEDLVRFIEAQDSVRFMGELDNMPAFYSALDVYVLSSRSEGLGTSLLEAGACGCAVVSSDCGGPSDFIRHGYNGFLFPVEDDEALFRIIRELLEDDDRRISAAKNFAETLDEYSIETVCRETVSRYNRLALLTA